jgi:hypothetical protein
VDYWHGLVIPTQTPLAEPVREELGVCPGVVKHVWVFFPKGHAGYTHLRILRSEHQVWPTNPGGWYLGDGTVIGFTENYLLDDVPYGFILEGYNTSIDHAHTVYVRLTLHPIEEVFIPGPEFPVEGVF